LELARARRQNVPVDKMMMMSHKNFPGGNKASLACPFDMPRLRNQLELLLPKAACPRQRPFFASGRTRKGDKIDANL
jgi:hypothetical protein